MKVILKNEYLHEDWDAMGLQPLTCQRPYVEYYEPNNSGGISLKEVGPFGGCREANEWVMSHKELWTENHPHLQRR
jgi:hypothetical protein